MMSCAVSACAAPLMTSMPATGMYRANFAIVIGNLRVRAMNRMISILGIGAFATAGAHPPIKGSAIVRHLVGTIRASKDRDAGVISPPPPPDRNTRSLSNDRVNAMKRGNALGVDWFARPVLFVADIDGTPDFKMKEAAMRLAVCLTICVIPILANAAQT